MRCCVRIVTLLYCLPLVVRAQDLTHQVVKVFSPGAGVGAGDSSGRSSSMRRSGSTRVVAELVLSVNAWSVVESLVDEIC